MREERRFFELLRCLRRRRLEEPEDSSDELEGELLGLYDRSDSSGSLEVLEDSLEDSLEDEELEEDEEDDDVADGDDELDEMTHHDNSDDGDTDNDNNRIVTT